MPRSPAEKEYAFKKGVRYAAEVLSTGQHLAQILSAQEEDDPDVMEGIDAEIFECGDCGFWCDRGEETEEGYCEECREV